MDAVRRFTLLTLVAFAGTAHAGVIGHSSEGRPIRVVLRGDPEAARTLLVVGCIHGDEPAGRAVIARLRRLGLPRGLRLVLVDDLNPDGHRRGTRVNARGVDLNRNFDGAWRPGPRGSRYPGRKAFSEPETRALRRIVLRERPDVTIVYHQALHLVYEAAGDSAIARRYARRVGFPVRESPPYRGTESRWQHTLLPSSTSFVVELGPGRLTTQQARKHAQAALTTNDE